MAADFNHAFFISPISKPIAELSKNIHYKIERNALVWFILAGKTFRALRLTMILGYHIIIMYI